MLKCRIYLLAALFLLLEVGGKSASPHSPAPLKALFYVPNLSYSHVAFNARIADLLAQNGHNVTFLLVDIDPTVADGGAPSLVAVRRVDVGLGSGIFPRVLWRNPGPYEDASPLNPLIMRKLYRISGFFHDACESLMSNRRLIDELRRERYDVGFAEQYDSCGFGLFRSVDVRTTYWMGATAIFRTQPEAMGILYPLSYVPELFSPFASQMRFLERVHNYLIAQVSELGQKWIHIAGETRIVHRHESRASSRYTTAASVKYRRFNNSSSSSPLYVSSMTALCENRNANIRTTSAIACEEPPPSRVMAPPSPPPEQKSLLALAAESAAILSNSSPFLDFPAPTAAFIRAVAGITVERGRRPRLNHQWSQVVDGDESKRGFWLVTFGSIARTSEMSAVMLASLSRAFAAFPQLDFYVKFESVEHPRRVERVGANVYYTKWIPQMDLIAHNKCLGIITHAGWSSVLEAVLYSRPMILMPLFADHYKNARIIERKGLGIAVDKARVDLDTFTDALREITTNPRFVDNCRRYARILDDYRTNLISEESLILYEVRHIAAEGSTPKRRWTTLGEGETAATPSTPPFHRRRHQQLQLKQKTLSFFEENFFVAPLAILILVIALLCPK